MGLSSHRAALTPQVRLFSNCATIFAGLEKTDAEICRVALACWNATWPSGQPGHAGRPRGVKLSGGQAQRGAAARMFVREPELLVFDDLSSALDVETEGQLWERLFENNQFTCLVVSHRRRLPGRYDHIDEDVRWRKAMKKLLAARKRRQLWNQTRVISESTHPVLCWVRRRGREENWYTEWFTVEVIAHAITSIAEKEI
jgi:ABC-type transporter Mla maintaining outer membrane lipid asymmetry ATPase subunit MlaF